MLPAMLTLMALSIVYAGWGNLGAVAALFFGLKAAVLAVVLQAVLRVGGKALKNATMMAIAGLTPATMPKSRSRRNGASGGSG